MPVYLFHCHACGKDFEKVIPERDRKHVSCPDCGARAEQRIPVSVSHYWNGGAKLG